MTRRRMMEEDHVYRVGGAPPVALSDAAGGQLYNYQITGDMMQPDTPSPDNPAPVIGLGENGWIDVKYNLFDFDRARVDLSQPVSVWSKTVFDKSDMVKLFEANTPYRFRYTAECISVPDPDMYESVYNNRCGFAILGKNSSDLSYTTLHSFNPSTSLTVGEKLEQEYEFMLTKSDFAYDTLLFLIYVPRFKTADGSYINGTFRYSNVSVTKKENLLDSLQKIRMDTPLYAGDTIDYRRQNVTRRTGVYEFDGTEFYNDNYLPSIIVAAPIKGITTGHLYCTHAGKRGIRYSNTNGNFFAFDTLETTIAPGIDWGGATNSAELKAYLAAQKAAGTPVTIYYELAEPYTEHIPLPPLEVPSGSPLLTADDGTLTTSDLQIKYKKQKGSNT